MLIKKGNFFISVKEWLTNIWFDALAPIQILPFYLINKVWGKRQAFLLGHDVLGSLKIKKFSLSSPQCKYNFIHLQWTCVITLEDAFWCRNHHPFKLYFLLIIFLSFFAFFLLHRKPEGFSKRNTASFIYSSISTTFFSYFFEKAIENSSQIKLHHVRFFPSFILFHPMMMMMMMMFIREWNGKDFFLLSWF